MEENALSNLTPSQKAQLNTLEAQGGLPVGFYSSINIPSGAEILFTTHNGSVIQVGLKHPDSTVSVQSYKAE